MPIYNVENYLRKCIDSIINQTYNNLEIILVDDGSPDNCGKICDEYAEVDSRIKVIHKENGGLSDARNVGIDVATGKYIAFVDSDDYIDKNMYEKLYSAIKINKADIAVSDYLEVDENSEPYNKRITSKKQEIFSGKEFLNKMYEYGYMHAKVNSACNKLFKIEVFKNIRYPYGKLYEDEFTHYKILYNTKKIVDVNEILYFYFIRSNSIMRSEFDCKTRDDLLEAYYEELQFYKSKQEDEFEKKVAKQIIIESKYNYIISEKQKYYDIFKINYDNYKKNIIFNSKENIKIYLFRYIPNIYMKLLKLKEKLIKLLRSSK